MVAAIDNRRVAVHSRMSRSTCLRRASRIRGLAFAVRDRLNSVCLFLTAIRFENLEDIAMTRNAQTIYRLENNAISGADVLKVDAAAGAVELFRLHSVG